MTGNAVFRDVLDELAAPAREHEPDWPDVVRRARTRGGLRRLPSASRARVLAAAVALLAAVGVGVAIAATTDILEGAPAPPENDAALRQLFPPLAIGPATELASRNGRTLFGARTRSGGYCFSATSPVDPTGAGGHCVSEAEARALDRRRVVAFAMSGSSVGGYAPGADYVRITGAGLEVEIPVSRNGWWVGEVRLGKPPLPAAVDDASVVATAYEAGGREIAADPLLRIRRRGDAYSIAFV